MNKQWLHVHDGRDHWWWVNPAWVVTVQHRDKDALVIVAGHPEDRQFICDTGEINRVFGETR